LTTNYPPQSELTSLVIDPTAESTLGANKNSLAQKEVGFYEQTGEQYRLLHNQQNLGWLGKFFGANSSAPTNIAGFVIICSLLILALSLLANGNPELVESRKWLVGLITSALSFIFGAASRK
jgi:hypothetical protein